jgi:hypothetical protein
VTIRASGQVIAESVLPIFVPGTTTTLPVETTAYGETFLKDHSGFPVTVTVLARNLVATQAAATTTGNVQ